MKNDIEKFLYQFVNQHYLYKCNKNLRSFKVSFLYQVVIFQIRFELGISLKRRIDLSFILGNEEV